MTEGKNSNSEPKDELPKKERQFNQEQYDRLLKCSKKGPEGIEEWNEWRRENPDEKIWLQGANLESANLRRANLQGANLVLANLRGAMLFRANLQGAYLRDTNLQDTKLWGANLQGAYLRDANLQGAELQGANLEGAKLLGAKLQGVELWIANLQVAELQGANLQGANLESAKLQGAELLGAKLQDAKFTGVVVDGSTSFLYCEIDEDTDFRETSLENVCIESGTKTLLKYNIRRMNWKDWYKQCKWYNPWQWPIRNIFVRTFWLISNYGRSTGRIMLTFLGLAIAFAFVYSLWPCCVMVNGEVGDIRGYVHALYFSVVTMTTLGFGDIAANPDSWPGQVVLMVQVILGYVLLGALVTRLAVLFTSDGPAGSFTAMDKETKALLSKLKEDKGS